MDAVSVIPTSADRAQLIAAVNATMLGGTMTANTKPGPDAGVTGREGCTWRS